MAVTRPVAAGRIPDPRAVEDLFGRPSPQKVAATVADRVRAADVLVGRKLPEPQWAVKDLLPEGVALLGGKPKMGKSWWGLGLGIAVARGEEFLGKPTKGGEVLLLALEDTERRLQSRLFALIGKDACPMRLSYATTWSRLDAGGIEELRAWLQAHPQARLVVIDTLAKVRSERRRNQTLYESDYEPMADLQKLAGQYGVCIIVICHLRKMGADDPFDTLSGTLGLTGAADTVLVLQREHGRHDAVLHITGRDVDEQELALAWEPPRWRLLGDAAQFRMSKQRAAILDYLSGEDQGCTPRVVARGLSMHESTVKTLLRKLLENGFLISKDGRYRLLK